MRRTAAEKYEIIRLVEGSDLPVRRTLRELQVNRSTFYTWYRRYAERGRAGLHPKPSAARRGAGLAADGPGGPFSFGIKRLSHPEGV